MLKIAHVYLLMDNAPIWIMPGRSKTILKKNGKKSPKRQRKWKRYILNVTAKGNNNSAVSEQNKGSVSVKMCVDDGRWRMSVVALLLEFIKTELTQSASHPLRRHTCWTFSGNYACSLIVAAIRGFRSHCCYVIPPIFSHNSTKLFLPDQKH